MPIWESGDLICLLDGGTGNRRPVIAAWSMPDCTFRGMVNIYPPLSTTGGIAPVLPVINPANTLLYAYSDGALPAAYDDALVYSDGTPMSLDIDRDTNVSLQYGQAFDAAGNRYIGDWNFDIEYHIRKITPEGFETVFPIDTNDPRINQGESVDITRLQVNQAGTQAWWNPDAEEPFTGGNYAGYNRMDLSSGMLLPYFDYQAEVNPATNRYEDFVIGPVNEYAYLSITIDNFPFVVVINPYTDEQIAIYQTGISNCANGNLAINCDETLLAIMHSDPGISDIEIKDPLTGEFINSIDYFADTMKPVIRGMCFAPCAAVSVVYPGIARVPRVGTTQDLFTRTTP